MQATPFDLPGPILLEPQVFGDHRGCFFESFNQQAFDQAIGQSVAFVQDNYSESKQGVLRGLHYQVPPAAQGKLVRVVQGEVFDVAADLRRDSPTFGQHVSQLLSAENKKLMWVPEGFAHGFLVLSDLAGFEYKVTHYYSSAHERTIRWNDPDLGIAWPLEKITPILSDKDASAGFFQDAESIIMPEMST